MNDQAAPTLASYAALAAPISASYRSDQALDTWTVRCGLAPSGVSPRCMHMQATGRLKERWMTNYR